MTENLIKYTCGRILDRSRLIILLGIICPLHC